MIRWTGWGRGPAGAGAAPPSRTFLVIALASCVVIAFAMFAQEKYEAGAAATIGAIYFIARVSGLGRPR